MRRTWPRGCRSPTSGSTGRPTRHRSSVSCGDEQATLRPLPQQVLPRCAQRVRRRVAADALVDVDTVRYSVPHRLVRDHVEVAAGNDEVRIFNGTALVATHRRSPERMRAWSTRRTGPACGAPVPRRFPSRRRPRSRRSAHPRGLRGGHRRPSLSVVTQARVVEHLQRLRLGFLAERLDALLADAARTEPTYLDFLDQLLQQETAAKQRKRVAMGIQIATSPRSKRSTTSTSSFRRRSISGWCASSPRAA